MILSLKYNENSIIMKIKKIEKNITYRLKKHLFEIIYDAIKCIRKYTIYEKRVVYAAAEYPYLGINNRFKITFIIAAKTELTATIQVFS